jgi:DnaJ like chaperone protein
MMSVPTMAPKDLKKWLILLAILYLVFPRDLIPDSVGRGLGWLDDLVVMGLLANYLRRYTRNYMAGPGPAAADPEAPSHDTSTARDDPYAILEISRGASQEEIQSAYRARMREYHPDKVAHLGEELQKLAHRRSVEIQQAYQRLRR